MLWEDLSPATQLFHILVSLNIYRHSVLCSILDFAKDNDYTITMVDNLLDILTHGEHRRTKRNLEDRRKMREEEERMRVILDNARSHETINIQPSPQTTAVQQSQGPQACGPQPTHTPLAQVNIPIQAMNLDTLKSLSDLGIDTGFLEGVGMYQLFKKLFLIKNAFCNGILFLFSDKLKKEVEEQKQTQAQLNHTGGLLENLQQVQSDRLSNAPPSHLSQVLQPSITEQHLGKYTFWCYVSNYFIIKASFHSNHNFLPFVAEKITENLTDLAKRVPPTAIVPVTAIRKAMGVSPEIQNTGDRGSSSASEDHIHVDSSPQPGGKISLLFHH